MTIRPPHWTEKTDEHLSNAFLNAHLAVEHLRSGDHDSAKTMLEHVCMDFAAARYKLPDDVVENTRRKAKNKLRGGT